jgi:hypothetical protein
MLNLKPTEVNKRHRIDARKKNHIPDGDDKNMTRSRRRWYSHEFLPTSTSE